MLRKVFLLALLGVCCGSIFEQSVKFSKMHKGIHRFSVNIPKQIQEMGSALDQLKRNPELLGKLSNSLLLRGQPFGSFMPPHQRGRGRLQSYSIKSCSQKPEEDTFVVNKLLVEPDPVALPGSLTFVFNITITQEIDSLQAALDLRKKVGEQYIRIPCIGEFGSCTYDVCGMLTSIVDCPEELEQIKFDCKCPFRKGQYESSGITADIDADIFPTGDYMVIANLTTPAAVGPDRVEAACYNVTLTIEEGN